MSGESDGAFVGNESYAVPGETRGPVIVRPVVDTSTTPRQIASYGIANFLQVGSVNTAVLQSTVAPRPVSIQNVGMVPVWVTNGQALAPNGWRVGAGETWQMDTDQAIYLCALPNSISAVTTALRAFVAVTG